MKVKVFREYYCEDLEREINHWLEESNVDVIKLSSSTTMMGNSIYMTVVILYRA